MKRTHWFRNTIITVAVCALAGIILAVILFNANPERTSASSSIQFSFNGAAEGLAPNGYRFDLSGFTSEEVLSAALADVGLSDRYTTDQIRGNLLITGAYPENIIEQMTGYESLLTGDAGKTSVKDYHATYYTVTLYNDFDRNISRANLEKLLENIMAEFRTYFERTYMFFLGADNLLESLSEYDYPQQLEVLESAVSRHEAFAGQMAEEHPEFLMNGEGFADIAVQYRILRTSDLERLSGIVTMNALSQDQNRITDQYENRIKILEIRLRELDQRAKDMDSLISGYNKDDIIYVSTAGTLQQVGGNSTETYDSLVQSYHAIEASISSLNKELIQVKQKLADIQGETTAQKEKIAETETTEASETDEITAEQVAVVSEEEREAHRKVVEANVSATKAKLDAITERFAAVLKAFFEKEMDDSTLAVSAVLYESPKLLSGEFAKKVIEVAGPVCALGFIACLVGIIISRKKGEKTEA